LLLCPTIFTSILALRFKLLASILLAIALGLRFRLRLVVTSLAAFLAWNDFLATFAAFLSLFSLALRFVFLLFFTFLLGVLGFLFIDLFLVGLL